MSYNNYVDTDAAWRAALGGAALAYRGTTGYCAAKAALADGRR